MENCMTSFPEINPEQIKLVQKKQVVPLTTTPSPLNLFRKKKNWKYTIRISTKSIAKLDPVLYKNLSYKAQIGVMSHELSHVADFQNNNRWYILKVFFSHLNPKKIDAFEFNTDRICIQHGKGLELFAWSDEIRKKFPNSSIMSKTPERYMSPATICRELHKLPTIYNKKEIPCSE